MQNISTFEPLAQENGQFAHLGLKVQHVIDHLRVVNENVIRLSTEDLAAVASWLMKEDNYFADLLNFPEFWILC